MLYQWMKVKLQTQNNSIKKQAENNSCESVFGLFLFNNKYCLNMKYEKPENLYFSAYIIKNKHFGYWEG